MPHTHSNTSQQITPPISNLEKVISRRFWKERTLVTLGPVIYFPGVSSSSSDKVVIGFFESSSKALEYSEERCTLFNPFFSRVKIEEASSSSPPFTFHTFLEPG